MATIIEQIGSSTAAVAERAGRSVVGVGQRWGAGSGVVVAPGRVLTNAHNLRGEETTVTFSDGRQAAATQLGVDVDGDLAVLSVDTGEAPPIDWGDAAAVGIGTPLFALANPGGRGLRVTFGLVSGTQRAFRGPRGRRIAGAIEHTAPLLPGSSGGPIVDARGALLGVNTNRLGEGFYLALPADGDLRRRVDDLARGESPVRPQLGVGVAPPRVARRLRRAVGLPEADGLLIVEVEEGSPAARAGLRRGDLITEAGGRPVDDTDALHDAVDALAAGARLALGVLRGAEALPVEVTFAPPGAES